MPIRRASLPPDAFEFRAGEIARAVLDALPGEGAHGCALLLRRAVAILESGCLPSPGSREGRRYRGPWQPRTYRVHGLRLETGG